MLLSGEILFPVRTASEHEAEAQITALAQCLEKPVSVLVHRAPRWPTDHVKLTTTVRERLQRSGVRIADTCALEGNWTDCIIRHAHERDPSMIFVPAGEEARLDRRDASTDAISVTVHAEHSVWLAKPHTPPTPRSIICAVDGGRASAEALRMAIELCRGFRVPLITVYAAREPMQQDPWTLGMTAQERGEGRASAREQVQFRHDAFLAGFGFDGLVQAPDHRLVWGERASDTLLEVAAAEHESLLVLGSAGVHRFLRFMLGTTANRVVGNAPCSLLVVRY